MVLIIPHHHHVTALQSNTCITVSISAEGLAVTLTLTDPVPKSIRAAYHTFGVLSFTQGLCTIILTFNSPQCVSVFVSSKC